MKAYGYKRRDRLTCRYGCCSVMKGGYHRRSRPKIDAINRKRARRLGRFQIRKIYEDIK